jgi:hypothetical protein
MPMKDMGLRERRMRKFVGWLMGCFLSICEFPLLLDQYGKQHKLKRCEMGQEMRL